MRSSASNFETSEGYYNFENNKYIYSYTDHLGNIRVNYFKNQNGSAEVLEENNFYPFGMKHEGYNALAGNPSYNYQFSGKEYQKETGWSDYGARMYMSDIARWGVIDPLAETSRRFNPYNYAYDNPISFIDPDGRKALAVDEGWAWNTPAGSGWSIYGNERRKFGAFQEFVEKMSGNEEERGSGGTGAKASSDPTPKKNTWKSIKNFFSNLFGGKEKGANITTFLPGADIKRAWSVKDIAFVPIGVEPELVTGSNKKQHWFQPVAEGFNNGLEYILKEHLYMELSGELNVGSYFDLGLINGIEADIGERSTIADFSYIKDAGSVDGKLETNSYSRGDKGAYTFGGAYAFSVKYSKASDDRNSVTIGFALVGWTISWGGGQPISNFVGLDTGVSAGLGFGGTIAVKTGIKW